MKKIFTKYKKQITLGVAIFLASFFAAGILLIILLDRNIRPEFVQVTNLTDAGATVSWYTEDKTISRLYFREKTNDSQWSKLPVITKMGKDVYYDDRDMEESTDPDVKPGKEWIVKESGNKRRHTHHVTLRGLEPETEYEIRIGGVIKTIDIDKNGDFLPTITTSEIIEDLKLPDPAYGQVNIPEDVKGDNLLYVRLLYLEEFEDSDYIAFDKFVSTTITDYGTYSVDLSYFTKLLPDIPEGQMRLGLTFIRSDGQNYTASVNFLDHRPIEDVDITGEGESESMNSLVTPVSAVVRPGCARDCELLTQTEGEDYVCFPRVDCIKASICSVSGGVCGSSYIPVINDGYCRCQERTPELEAQLNDPNNPYGAEKIHQADVYEATLAQEPTYQQLVDLEGYGQNNGTEGSPCSSGCKSPTQCHTCHFSSPEVDEYLTNQGDGFDYCVGKTITGIAFCDTLEYTVSLELKNQGTGSTKDLNIAPVPSNVQPKQQQQPQQQQPQQQQPQPPQNQQQVNPIGQCWDGIRFKSTTDLTQNPERCYGGDLKTYLNAEFDSNAQLPVCVFDTQVSQGDPRCVGVTDGDSPSQAGGKAEVINCSYTIPGETTRALSNIPKNTPICRIDDDLSPLRLIGVQAADNITCEFDLTDISSQYSCAGIFAGREAVAIQQQNINQFDSSYCEYAGHIYNVQEFLDQPLRCAGFSGLRYNGFYVDGNGDVTNTCNFTIIISDTRDNPKIECSSDSAVGDRPTKVTDALLDQQKELISISCNAELSSGSLQLISPIEFGEIYCIDAIAKQLVGIATGADLIPSCVMVDIVGANSQCNASNGTKISSRIFNENDKFNFEIFTPVSAQEETKDNLEVTESGKYYTYYGDYFDQPVAEFAVNLDGADKAEIRFFIDSNGNGKKDDDEEMLPNYTQLSLKKDSSVATYTLNAGWNLITFPLISNQGISTASELVDHFNTQGAEIKHIASYTDAGFVMYTQREEGQEFSNDFNLVPGQGYFILNYGQAEVELTGNKFDEEVPFRVRNGWNLVGVYTNEKVYTAEELLKDMAESGIEADVASMYDSGLYTSVVYEDDLLYGNNYNIIERRGYFIRVNSGGGADVRFTPSPEE